MHHNSAGSNNYYLNLALFFLSSLAFIWRSPNLDFYYVDIDHGYLLAMGTQIRLGLYPYIDYLSVYGPFNAWLSAAIATDSTLWLVNIVCGTAYALCLVIIFNLLKRYYSILLSLIISIGAIWFVGRFHKWFIWLFPLLLLYCYQRSLESNDIKQQCWWALTGIIAGLGALFRLEFGAAYILVFALVIALEWWHSDQRKTVFTHHFCSFSVGFISIMALWLALLAYYGGTNALYNYVIGTIAGAKGAVIDWSISRPAFNLSAPFTINSTMAVSYLLLPLSYSICILFGILQSAKNPHYYFYLAVGLMGWAIFPQGVYRADMPHLQQTLGCAFISIPLAIRGLWQFAKGHKRIWKFTLRGGVVVFTVSVLVWGSLLFKGPQFGWQPFKANSLARLENHKPSESKTVEALLTRKILELSGADNSVLIAATLPQLYYFTQRRMAGVNLLYFKGIHDSGTWADKNLKEIKQDPPKLIVVHRLFNTEAQNLISHLPEKLVKHIQQNYQTIEYEIGEWQLRSASQTQ